MKRILMMILRNLLYVPYAFVKVCWYASHMEKYSEEQKYALLKDIDERAIRSGNVTIEVSGQENIPEKDGFIIYPNHQGMFDVLAIMHGCPKRISVVVKKELEKIYILKKILLLMNGLFMDRQDLKQSMKVILDVIREVKNGRNYVIFPEGTRSRRGNELLEFKGGSFKAATKAKCPIVPAALIDSYKAFDTGSTKQVTVKLIFLPPMYFDEYKDMTTQDIAAEVKRRIEETIRQNV